MTATAYLTLLLSKPRYFRVERVSQSCQAHVAALRAQAAASEGFAHDLQACVRALRLTHARDPEIRKKTGQPRQVVGDRLDRDPASFWADTDSLPFLGHVGRLVHASVWRDGADEAQGGGCWQAIVLLRFLGGHRMAFRSDQMTEVTVRDWRAEGKKQYGEGLRKRGFRGRNACG